MADERDPLRLPPPIIGNPYIGDIGRGGDPAMTPREPAIPFVLWYGANEPAPPSTDAPPRPIVVTADGPITAPMVGYNIIKTMVSPPDVQRPQPSIVGQQQSLNQLFQQPFVFVERPLPDPPGGTPPEVLVHASVAPLQQLTPPWPFTYVSQTHTDPPAAPIAPARPLVVEALEAPTSLPEVFTAAVRAVVDTPAKPVMVRAVELPWTPPQALVAQTRVAPPAVAPDIPVRPTVVSAWTPVDPGSASWVGFNADSGISLDAPTKATVVGQVQPPPQQSFISISRSLVAPAVAPQVPPKPIVVGQVPAPSSTPFISVVQPRVFAAAPVAGDMVMKPVVVSAWTPVDGGFATWTGFNADSGIATDAPMHSLVVAAQQPPQQLPFISVVQPKVFAAAPVVGDKATKPAVVGWPFPPEPVDQVILWAVVSDARPPEPTIVDAGPVPIPKPFSFVGEVPTPFVPPPPVPIRSTVVNAQPLPQPTQAPQSFRARVDPPPPPQIVMRPLVVGQQPIPPQAPFLFAPKGGRWGDPPPRIITPQVTTDMTLPFRPNGWVRVAHGFAEALPLLFEGSVVGGTLEGPRVSGGVLTGSAIGGTIQNGYVTGGLR